MTSPTRVKASDPFFGQPELGRYLRTGLTSQRLPRVMLFSGPKDLGKGQAAVWMAQFHFCSHASDKPCQQCQDCRAIIDHTHPEVFLIDDPDQRTIGVDDIRQVFARFSTIGQRPSRWLVILEASRLTETAVNSMLKFLEDLPSGVYVIMTTSALHHIPSTIRSRSSIYYWNLVTSTIMRRSIPRSANSPAVIARAAGRPGWLTIDAESDRSDDEDQRVAGVVRQLRDGTTTAPNGPAATQRERIQETLDFEELVVRELVLTMAESSGRSLWPTQRPQFTRLAQQFGLARLLNLAERYLERSTYSSHLQPKLLYADLHLA